MYVCEFVRGKRKGAVRVSQAVSEASLLQQFASAGAIMGIRGIVIILLT